MNNKFSYNNSIFKENKNPVSNTLSTSPLFRYKDRDFSNKSKKSKKYYNSKNKLLLFGNNSISNNKSRKFDYDYNGGISNNNRSNSKSTYKNNNNSNSSTSKFNSCLIKSDSYIKLDTSFINNNIIKNTTHTNINTKANTITNNIISNNSDGIDNNNNNTNSQISQPIKCYLRIKPHQIRNNDENNNNINTELLSNYTVSENLSNHNTHTHNTNDTNNNTTTSFSLKNEQYYFSKVFSESETQQTIWKETAKPIIDDFINKLKPGLLFSYGNSNSGKTYTIIGENSNPGILPISLSYVYNRISKLKTSENNDVSVFSNINYSNINLYCSFIEIYNEEIIDLLKEEGEDNYNNTAYVKIQIREKDKKFILVNNKEVIVSSLDSLEQCLNLGIRNKKHLNTKLNQNSSRSHTIFSFYLKELFSEKEEGERLSSLSIVDLAGSEKLKYAETQGKGLKETCKINSSLVVLKACFEALKYNSKLENNNNISHFNTSNDINLSNLSFSNTNTSVLSQNNNNNNNSKCNITNNSGCTINNNINKKPIPYRESKLTMIFQEYLNTHSNIILISNVSLLKELEEDNIRMLNNTATARAIKLAKTKINNNCKNYNNNKDNKEKGFLKSQYYKALEENENLKLMQFKLLLNYNTLKDQYDYIRDKNNDLIIEREIEKDINENIIRMRAIKEYINTSNLNNTIKINSTSNTNNTNFAYDAGSSILGKLKKHLKYNNDINETNINSITNTNSNISSDLNNKSHLNFNNCYFASNTPFFNFSHLNPGFNINDCFKMSHSDHQINYEYDREQLEEEKKRKRNLGIVVEYLNNFSLENNNRNKKEDVVITREQQESFDIISVQDSNKSFNINYNNLKDCNDCNEIVEYKDNDSIKNLSDFDNKTNKDNYYAGNSKYDNTLNDIHSYNKSNENLVNTSTNRNNIRNSNIFNYSNINSNSNNIENSIQLYDCNIPSINSSYIEIEEENNIISNQIIEEKDETRNPNNTTNNTNNTVTDISSFNSNQAKKKKKNKKTKEKNKDKDNKTKSMLSISKITEIVEYYNKKLDIDIVKEEKEDLETEKKVKKSKKNDKKTRIEKKETITEENNDVFKKNIVDGEEMRSAKSSFGFNSNNKSNGNSNSNKKKLFIEDEHIFNSSSYNNSKDIDYDSKEKKIKKKKTKKKNKKNISNSNSNISNNDSDEESEISQVGKGKSKKNKSKKDDNSLNIDIDYDDVSSNKDDIFALIEDYKYDNNDIDNKEAKAKKKKKGKSKKKNN